MFVSLHQPEFFPWAGFFNKIATVQKMVLLDNVQFKKNYFDNRCRIIVGGEAKWLTVPVLHGGRHGQRICDVAIDNRSSWGKKMWRTLSQSYGNAPFWNDHADFLETTLSRRWEKLADLNVTVIEYYCRYLDLACDLVLGTTIDVTSSGSDLVLDICRSLGASEYLSGRLGVEYLDPESFDRAGIELRFQQYEPGPYPQFNGPGDTPLSILDMTMNLGRGATGQIRAN